ARGLRRFLREHGLVGAVEGADPQMDDADGYAVRTEAGTCSGRKERELVVAQTGPRLSCQERPAAYGDTGARRSSGRLNSTGVSGATKQAARWSGATGRSGGVAARHWSMAKGHLQRNRQPG